MQLLNEVTKNYINRPPWPDFHYNDKDRESTTGIVIHYTAAQDPLITAEWMAVNDQVQASAHYYLGRPGEPNVCAVPHSKIAYHAGYGDYYGANPNLLTIGIELANWGYLKQKRDHYVTWAERKYEGATPQKCDHYKIPNQPGYVYWEPYQEAQINNLINLIRALMDEYPQIQYIAGHNDLDRRKHDPGPVFDWARILETTGLTRYQYVEFDEHIFYGKPHNHVI